MEYVLTTHAREEMVRRQIDPAWVERVMKDPEQRLPGAGNRAILQTRIETEGKLFLPSEVHSRGLAQPAGRRHRLSNDQDRQVLEVAMKVTHDRETDILQLVFTNAPVEESDEDKPGVIIDYDKNGNVVGMEILDASKRVEDPQAVRLDIA